LKAYARLGNGSMALGRAIRSTAAMHTSLPQRVITRTPGQRSHVSFFHQLRTFRCIGFGQLCAITRREQVQQDAPEKAPPTYSMTSSASASRRQVEAELSCRRSC
jgi:hypothetical protein